LQQLLVTASRSGKENEMSRENVKRLLFGTIAVVIVVKVARDIMKAKKQEKDALMDAFDDFYEDELNWWDRELDEGEDL